MSDTSTSRSIQLESGDGSMGSRPVTHASFKVIAFQDAVVVLVDFIEVLMAATPVSRQMDFLWSYYVF